MLPQFPSQGECKCRDFIKKLLTIISQIKTQNGCEELYHLFFDKFIDYTLWSINATRWLKRLLINTAG